MTTDSGTTRRINGGNPMQPFVALLGTSLQFSDHLLKVFREEFAEVQFERAYDPRDVLGLEAPPNLIVLHEGVPGLRARIEELGSAFPGSMLAVACSDPMRFQRAHQAEPLPPISLLPINVQIDVWLSVLRLMLCGHVYVPADIGSEWNRPTNPEPRRREQNGSGRPAEAQLTPRELQILPLIARGMQNKTIAGELGLSEHTVKLHTHNIYSKLKVSNRTGAANWYLSQIEASPAPGHDAYGK